MGLTCVLMLCLFVVPAGALFQAQREGRHRLGVVL
jgi:hypothetical protein